jgi:aspartyl protease
LEVTTEALIDTGADVSLFDARFASKLEIDLDPLPHIALSGVGGLLREASVAEVTLRLLDAPALEVRLEVAFASDVESIHGNLIGLDVLEHFGFGLSHNHRVGYLSPAT